MGLVTPFFTVFLAAVVALVPSSALCAQQTKTSNLDEVLKGLESNLNRYDTRLPSLFCDEHVVSLQMEPNQRDVSTVTDSVFQLSRKVQPGHMTAFVESREVKTVNGRPATSQDVDAPTMLSGLFEGGLAVVSLNQTACMSYTLRRVNGKHPNDPYIVRFSTVLTTKNSADCFLQEKSRGQALIDPASMQLKHLEIITPRHTIIDGDGYTPRVVGSRTLTIDYAPVLLGGETFQMPSAISMLNTTGNSFHQTAWSFRATYRNYHKREVTSRILPATESPAR
ncbi:hypothetical protein [Granulicella sp. L60]|uniref:hypothetical protein n=1 Tax=Granulicella sp. L60 TaxID=1641866 RepID=UPI00131E5AB7|nr:hypothetical protein [Granulicella sp. L60]